MTATAAAAGSADAWPKGAALRVLIGKYERPSVGRAAWQIVNSVVPYALVAYLAWRSVDISWWLTAPLAALAGLLLLRIFIIFHDCGHGSFFKSPKANAITGYLAGVLTVTPYHHWRWEHGLHHGTAGNLDRRGTGDIWTMTVREYLEASRWRRFAYRLSRNPFILFGVAPVFVFILRQRFSNPAAPARERHSVWWTNLGIFAMALALGLAFGFLPYLILQILIVMVAGSAGLWLFYVQHQFEHAYWERGDNWDYTAAAMAGSSYYALPAVLRWFTGNIGFHHIHHLSSRIPSYNLKRCHDANPVLHPRQPLTLMASWSAANLRLWDEQMRKLVSFVQLRAPQS